MYQSRNRIVVERLHRGIDAALLAAVAIPMAGTKADLARGFTTGDSTSGKSADSVKRTEVRGFYENGRYVSYGTSLFYHRFWTFGGFNAFTRQFERVDKWTPHFYENRGPMLAAAQAALKAALR
jgi:hypothetical protein